MKTSGLKQRVELMILVEAGAFVSYPEDLCRFGDSLGENSFLNRL